ncbi:MAG: tRNA lysidine(34) synthetase TilS [Alphaproteobacteria bacterium]|nr:tRNA lysidine(34) synthetase TilS [Alphaproteobacteria bacterium]
MPRPAPTSDIEPVAAIEFSDLMRPFAPFEARPVVALAVSGGRDSRALALLARAWAARRRGKAVALVVDHGLRPESAAEARQTCDWLTTRAIESHILPWRPAAGLRSGLQAAARAARYELLLAWCRRHGVLHLLTAHQADDQAETYVLRAARGSGPAGLAGMSAIVEFPEARVLRPLLAVSRARLTATLQTRGETWIDDPSNVDVRFARARLRREGLAGGHLAALRRARSFARQRMSEDLRLAAALADCAMPHPLGGVVIDPAAWLALSEGLAVAVLGSVVATVAGGDYPPRQARTLGVVKRLRQVATQPSRPPAGLTLGGCRILWRGGGWLVVREPASVSGDRPAGPTAGARWDGRFVGRDGNSDRLWPWSAPGRSASGPSQLGSAGETWGRAWPATTGLAVLRAGLPAGGQFSAWAMEGALGVPATAGKAALAAPQACFRPLRPLAPGPFFPCFGAAKGQIVNP